MRAALIWMTLAAGLTLLILGWIGGAASDCETTYEGAKTMHTNTYLLSFDTAAPVTPDDRLGLKELLGQIVRAGLGTDAPVAVDHLEPSEPHVAALLPPGD